MSQEKSRFPLAWPLGWPRTNDRVPSRFTSHRRDITIAGAIQRLENELERLGATEPLLSSNLKLSLSAVPFSGQAEPRDPAVAIYFKLKGHDRVLACDKYTSASGNIAAIAAHIDALRRIERYGVGTMEQAFAGYVGLPPPSADNRPFWRETFGIGPMTPVTMADVRAIYRDLAKRNANNEARLRELNIARDAAWQELNGA
jgi:hypothetical protein